MPLVLNAAEKAAMDRLETQVETVFTSGTEYPSGVNVIPKLDEYDQPMMIPIKGIWGKLEDQTAALKPRIKGPYKNLIVAMIKSLWEGWQAPSYENDWRDWPDTNYAPVRYRRSLLGQVRLRGLVSAPPSAPGSTIFTLPSGSRPGICMIFPVVANDALASIEVWPDGRVVARSGPSGNAPTSDTTWYSLSNITFEAEQ